VYSRPLLNLSPHDDDQADRGDQEPDEGAEALIAPSYHRARCFTVR